MSCYAIVSSALFVRCFVLFKKGDVKFSGNFGAQCSSAGSVGAVLSTMTYRNYPSHALTLLLRYLRKDRDLQALAHWHVSICR